VSRVAGVRAGASGVTDAQKSPRTLEQLAAEQELANRTQLTAIILRMQADALEGHAKELREIAKALDAGEPA
jgi:hypothetical protein